MCSARSLDRSSRNRELNNCPPQIERLRTEEEILYFDHQANGLCLRESAIIKCPAAAVRLAFIGRGGSFRAPGVGGKSSGRGECTKLKALIDLN